MNNIADIRTDYTRNGLHENDLLTNPIAQFKVWFQDALDSQILEPNGMVLSTINEHNQPSARVVLLKGIDDRGFTFFTNYESQKGQQLAQNPVAALTFWWVALERQVRIEGSVEKVSEAESDVYFESRPRGSRLGAWVSNQSEVIANREVLTQKQTAFEAQFMDSVPRPPHWGGYRVVPHKIEFWQGRSSRLHDRLQYTQNPEGWQIDRLSP